jgi:glycosyltransferase involved in cell wall biosynthesis
MRILMVCPQFRPLVGGYERAAERLAVRLVERGHAVTVVAERRDRSWPKHELHEGVTIRRHWCVFRPGLQLPTVVLSLLSFLLRKGRGFDVIHVHQYGWPVAISMLVGRLLRVPVVAKATSTGADGVVPVLHRLPGSRLLLALHRRVDAWIATSERASDEAVELGVPRERVTIITNGLDTRHFSPPVPGTKEELRAALGMRSANLVVFVGRMTEAKDPLLLVESWAAVCRAGRDAELAVLGDGPLMSAMEARIRELGLEDRLHLLGWIGDPVCWYRAADLLVVSSRNEGLSNSVLEGLSCGLPLVSTRVSGCEDILKATDAGILVEPRDASGLSRAIGELLDAPERRARCGEAAREYAKGA